MSSLNNGSFSFNWGVNSNPDLDKLKKDFIKLNEENKYLKKRIGNNNPVIADLKCEICPNYLEIIDQLRKEKDTIESDLSFQLSQETLKFEETETELRSLQDLFENQKSELKDKIKEESENKNLISALQKSNTELNAIIENVIHNKEGYEKLSNTVSDLSLALIGKNEGDLSIRQIQLIKNLFGESLIKAVNSYKQQMED